MSILFKSKKKKKKEWYESSWEFIESLGIALIMALMIKTSIVEAYRIPSGSMENSLLVGDFLLANKFVYGMKLPIPFTDIHLPAIEDPKPGDIVIFKYPLNPRLNYIKRCIAVEGQTVEIHNKKVYVDGKFVPLPPHGKHEDSRIISLHNPGRWGPGIRDNMPPKKVPKGYLFVMGDNRDNSADSRFWGFLDRRLIMGRAMIIHFSWATDPKSPEIEISNPLSIPEWFAYNIWHFPQRVRWNRLAKIIT